MVKELKEFYDSIAFEAGVEYKIWLDDVRKPTKDYLFTHSVNETIYLIECIEKAGGKIVLLDLDHDLGVYASDGGDAINLLDYLVERETFYPINIHSANVVGRMNMERTINRFWE